MKKLIVLLLALVLVLSFASCKEDYQPIDDDDEEVEETEDEKDDETDESSDEEQNENPAEPDTQTEPQTNEVAQFLEDNREEIVASMSEGLGSDAANVEVEAIENGWVFTLCMAELDEIPDEQKQMLQGIYDDMGNIWAAALDDFKTACPSIEYYSVKVCDSEGRAWATITADEAMLEAYREEQANSSTNETAPTPTGEPDATVLSYIEANKETLLSSLNESFAGSSGMTCNSNIEVIGKGFVITICINEFDNMPAESAQQMQEAYDANSATFEQALEALQTECPEIEYMKIDVCEVDADLLATIFVGELN